MLDLIENGISNAKLEYPFIKNWGFQCFDDHPSTHVNSIQRIKIGYSNLITLEWTLYTSSREPHRLEFPDYLNNI